MLSLVFFYPLQNRIEQKGDRGMKKVYKASERKRSIITCISVGIITSVVISLILTIPVTSLIQKGKLDHNGNIITFLIRSISVLAGALAGANMTSKRVIPVIGAVSIGYLSILLIIGLLFLDGTIISLGIGFISIAIGCGLACAVKLKPQKKRGKKLRLAK